MRLLLAPTDEYIKRARTRTTNDTVAGSSVVVSIQNSENFTVNDYVVIGTAGSEGAEMAKVTAKSATSITVDALALAHVAGEEVQVYAYNQRKFYGSATEDGSYTQLTSDGSPKNISVTDPQGTYLEYTGEDYSYFRATYYNSTTGAETSQSDSTATQGDESQRYCTIHAIRVQAGLTKNPFVTDGEIETYRARAENEVNSIIMANYVLPLENGSGDFEVPGIIENVTVLLAAGYLDYKEFGKDGEGVKWLGEARGILKAIRDNKQRLIGSDMAEMASTGSNTGVSSYPNAVDNDEGPVQHFTVNQQF